MAEYVVFYRRDDLGYGITKYPISAISYDGKISLIGNQYFMELWKPYFTSDEWKNKDPERKSLDALFSRSMLPIRFVTKEEYDQAALIIAANVVREQEQPKKSPAKRRMG